MASNTRAADDLLVERFVASFEKLDEMKVSDPIAQQLATGDRDEHRCSRWRPIKVDTEPSLLDPVYSMVPGRFPPLFERLVLSYRWAEVDLGSYRLMANRPGSSLDGLLHEMSNLEWPRVATHGHENRRGPCRAVGSSCDRRSDGRVLSGGQSPFVKLVWPAEMDPGMVLRARETKCR
jgi:hypothetical protein